MIGALSGNVIERSGEVIILDVHGVGYELTVSAGVLQHIRSIPQAARLTVFTDVRENAITLFGFQNQLEREVFLLLKKVKGVGSKIALAIISAIGPQELLMSIGRNDLAALKRVSGVGSKTAERLIVELREKVGELAMGLPEENLSASITKERLPSRPVGANAQNDAVIALEKLGFSLEHARQAVATTLAKHEANRPELRSDAGELLRLALGNL